MAKVSLNQASKDTQVSLPTLSRWRKAGKISAEKTTSGGYLIDTSEYDRILALKKQSPNMKPFMKEEVKDTVTVDETPLLKTELNALQDRLKDKDKIIDDLRDDRNDWKRQAQTLLLQPNPLQQKDQNEPKDSPQPPSYATSATLFGALLIVLIGIIIGQILIDKSYLP